MHTLIPLSYMLLKAVFFGPQTVWHPPGFQRSGNREVVQMHGGGASGNYVFGDLAPGVTRCTVCFLHRFAVDTGPPEGQIHCKLQRMGQWMGSKTLGRNSARLEYSQNLARQNWDVGRATGTFRQCFWESSFAVSWWSPCGLLMLC